MNDKSDKKLAKQLDKFSIIFLKQTEHFNQS